MSRPSGILLAGGASRRFGRPKLVEPLNGIPLFQWPLRALLGSCSEVVIVLAPDASEPTLPGGSDRVRFARDRVAYEGPLAGTLVGLEHVRGEHAVIVAADMPGVRPELLSLMTQRAAAGGRTAVLLSDADGRRPLPAIVMVAPALVLAQTLFESGERRLRALVEGLDPEGLPETVWNRVDAEGAWRDDLNTPGDLAKRTR